MQNMRELEAGKKRVKALISSYSEQAVQAEREGDHAQALRLASSVRQLKQYQTSSGAISSTLQAAHGMQTANRAVLDILEASGSLAGSVSAGLDPEQLCRMQTEMNVVAGQMQSIMEQNQMVLEMFDDGREEDSREEDEKYLKRIMEQTRKEKQTRILKDTDKQLDRLSQLRPASRQTQDLPGR